MDDGAGTDRVMSSACGTASKQRTQVYIQATIQLGSSLRLRRATPPFIQAEALSCVVCVETGLDSLPRSRAELSAVGTLHENRR